MKETFLEITIGATVLFLLLAVAHCLAGCSTYQSGLSNFKSDVHLESKAPYVSVTPGLDETEDPDDDICGDE